MLEKKISAIIMLSGYSRRMGENKLLINLEDKMIFEYVFDIVLKSDFFEIVIVARDKEILQKAVDYGFKVVENDEAYKGVSSSIKKGIEACSFETDAYMFFQGDQIFITKEDVLKIKESFVDNAIVMPKYNDTIGSPCIFSKFYKNNLLELKCEEGGKKIISSFSDNVIYKNIDNKYAFFDIDDTLSLVKARELVLKIKNSFSDN